MSAPRTNATILSSPHPRAVLVRHGETAWTLSGQHTGRTDLPLTERGEAQARTLHARLEGFSVVTVLTSPLQRARHTCELAGYGSDAVRDPDLMEWDYGPYEGRRTHEIRELHPGWNLFEDGCPGGEQLGDVSARADRVIARIRERSGDVLIFAHHDLLRILAVRWLGLAAMTARHLLLSTASISVLSRDVATDQPAILHWNDDRHLVLGEVTTVEISP